ncbi:type II secretion system protein [Actinoplanes missouriensis]|uniref:type II secretion system protein n=1 Tax=Actinoplanes missouriensis TaxID=1866 RepID=UPI003402633A
MKLRDESGVTLIELVVSMSVMLIMMAMVTGGIVEIYRSVDRTDAETEAQTQITAAYSRLDKEVRYARGVSKPATLDGDYYVEYQVDLDEVTTCVQLRLATGVAELQRRTWVSGTDPPSPSAWTTLASNVTATTPFTVSAVDIESLTGYRYQRLRLLATVTVGSGPSASSRVTDVTFTALNATNPKNTESTCTEGRGV